MMGRNIGKKLNRSKRTWLILGITAVVIVSGAYIWRFNKNKNNNYPINPGPTIQDEASKRSQAQDAQSTPSEGSSDSQKSSSLPAPTLTKSSGNNGSVPPGAIIEFICKSVEGASCNILLTSTTNPNNIITLGAKNITDSGRGEFAAIWNWTAQNGSWKVNAKATKDGSTATSQEQSLEVK